MLIIFLIGNILLLPFAHLRTIIAIMGDNSKFYLKIIRSLVWLIITGIPFMIAKLVRDTINLGVHMIDWKVSTRLNLAKTKSKTNTKKKNKEIVSRR